MQNRAEKQYLPFKTTVYWLFNDIWCYLVAIFFIEKLVGRVYSCNGLLYP